MSKRAGRIVTLRDVVDEVGRDVVRFIMLTRKNDAPLDFDLAKVTEQSKDNPVFYVQYAHARICSVFRNAAEDEGMGELAPHWRPRRRARLCSPIRPSSRCCARWPRSRACWRVRRMHYEPHRIAFYLQDLAGAFHALVDTRQGGAEPALPDRRTRRS